MKKTGFKDNKEVEICVEDTIWFKGEKFKVYKNVMPFNHFVIYNDDHQFMLHDVHKQCTKE